MHGDAWCFGDLGLDLVRKGFVMLYSGPVKEIYEGQ